MKKEGVTAIVFGILLGLTVAGIMVWRIRSTESTGRQIQSNSPTPVVRKDSATIASSLVITQPLTGLITKTSSITIKGETQKGSLVVAQSPLSEKTLIADSKSFSLAFPLALGENIIVIATYPTDKTIRPQQKTITVYYLDEQ